MTTDTQEPQNQQANYISNAGYNTANILAIRLDTQILELIENYLRGQIKMDTVDSEGNPVTRLLKIGEEKCNNKGIQGIMSFSQSIINSSVVQGNIKVDHWLMKNGRTRKEFTKMIITNTNDWQILDSNIEPICNTVMNLVYYFTSRLIDNKERESYGNYSQSQVTQVKAPTGGLFSMFGKKE